MRRIEKMNAQVNSWFSRDVIKIKKIKTDRSF